MLKNKTKILGSFTVITLLLGMIVYTDGSSFLSNPSMDRVKKLNNEYGMMLSVLDEKGTNVERQLFMAGLLEGESKNRTHKGLIASVEGKENQIFLLNPKKALSDKQLNSIASAYEKIPELEFVEIDQPLQLNQDSGVPSWIGGSSASTPSLPSLPLPTSTAVLPNTSPFLHSAASATTPVRIGVFDSGIDIYHPVFANTKLETGWDGMTNQEYTTGDEVGHGTHIAGIIAEKTPSATIIPYKITSKDGGKLSNLVLAMQKGLEEDDLEVINMSFGFSTPSDILDELIDEASEKGIILVAAAGNKKSDEPFYPAYYDNVIAVGSATKGGETVDNSNYGDWVDVAGLGEYIYSALPDNRYGVQTGTSQAAAYVSAKAAQMLATGALNGNKQASEISRLLNTNLDKVLSGNLSGLGLVK